jgi:hypothetical protein
MTRFAQEGIAVHAAERGGRRITYVVPETARARAAELLHETIGN